MSSQQRKLLYERESGWTSRTADPLPQYDALLDPHITNYHQKSPSKRATGVASPVSTSRSFSSSVTSRPATSDGRKSASTSKNQFARSFLGESQLVDPSSAMEHLFLRSKARLQALWQELHIPEREQAHFSRQFFDPPSAANHAHIALQISRLIEHRSATLHVLKCIDIREIYIAQLRDLAEILRDARDGAVDSSAVGQKVGQVVRDLRWVTVETMEAVQAWRHGLTRPYPFLWHRNNYVVKMATDLDFLVESELFALITYATTSNPLLLPRDTETGRAMRKAVLGDVKELEMQRIRSAERAILDEVDIQKRRVQDEQKMMATGYVPPTLRFLPKSDVEKSQEHHTDDGDDDEEVENQAPPTTVSTPVRVPSSPSVVRPSPVVNSVTPSAPIVNKPAALTSTTTAPVTSQPSSPTQSSPPKLATHVSTTSPSTTPQPQQSSPIADLSSKPSVSNPPSAQPSGMQATEPVQPVRTSSVAEPAVKSQPSAVDSPVAAPLKSETVAMDAPTISAPATSPVRADSAAK